MDEPKNRRTDHQAPKTPLRWNDRWTLLLTGPTMGLIGPLGSTWPNQSAEYERIDVCALPTGARVFPDRDPNKPAEEQGLFNKFIVMRTDGKDAPGEKHHGCAYFVLDLDHDRHAPAAMRAYASACSETHPALAADLVAKFGKPKLDDSEQYRLQMAAIGTASFGYWKEGDTIHPDYDTVPLRDVARLFAKYDQLYKFREQVRVMVAMLKNREWAEDLGATGDAAELQSVITELVGARLTAPAPDAVDAALSDAIQHGTGAFQVNTDGSTEHVELSKEAQRHYAELAAFPPKLQRDALYQDYAVPTKEDPT